MDTPDPRDPFESRLRDVLRSDSPSPANSEEFLHDVRRGARSRRRRHVVGAAAAVLLVAGGGFAVAESNVLDTGRTPLATSPTTSKIETSAPATTSSSTPDQTTSPPVVNDSVLSLTSTGDDAQWALALTKGYGCDRLDGCATVFLNSVNTDQWYKASTIPSAPTTDSTQRYAVSQIRFAGSKDAGYNGWAFGGGLLTTHGDRAGTVWDTPSVPVSGAVTELEAHGDTVYAVFEGEGGAHARLTASPVEYNDFNVVDTGQLDDVSELVVSDQVVAFLNSTPAATEIVEQVGSTWTRSNPCEDGWEPVELSAAGESLWALCKSGPHTAVAVRSAPDDGWANLDETFEGDAQLAALSPNGALVAESSGLTEVTGKDSAHLSDDDFVRATMFGFTNENVGFVILVGQVLRTDDGGKIWKPDDVFP
jgi:hypothetical protein